jgi:lipid-binding SYLF domain-containing protein
MFTTLARLAKLSVFGAVLGTWLFASSAHADDAQQIDQRVSAALERFRATVKNGAELIREAKGVVVIPDVKQAGLVVGGEWGEGALRVKNQTVGYYKLDAGSVGLQIGYKQADFIFLFLTDEALRDFQSSNGWTAGADVGATAGEASAGAGIDTLRRKHPTLGYALADKGLMAGVSVAGSKLTRFQPGK